MRTQYIMRQIYPGNMIEPASFKGHRSTSDTNEAYRGLEYWTNLYKDGRYKFQIEEEEYYV